MAWKRTLLLQVPELPRQPTSKLNVDEPFLVPVASVPAVMREITKKFEVDDAGKKALENCKIQFEAEVVTSQQPQSGTFDLKDWSLCRAMWSGFTLQVNCVVALGAGMCTIHFQFCQVESRSVSFECASVLFVLVRMRAYVVWRMSC